MRRLRTVIAVGAVAVLAGAGGVAAAPPAAAAAAAPHTVLRLAAAQVAHTRSFTATFSVVLKGSLGQLGKLNAQLGGSIALQTRPSLLVELKLTTVNLDIPGLGSSNLAGQLGAAGGLEAILTIKDLYLSGFGPAGKWYKIPLSSLRQQIGMSPGQLLKQLQGLDPLAESQLLADATHVRVIGRGRIGGVAVTEYAGTCPAGVVPVTPASKASPVLCTFRVWLDSRQRVRKLVLSERADGISGTFTLQVTSVNRPLHIHVPPPRDIIPLPGNLLTSLPFSS